MMVGAWIWVLIPLAAIAAGVAKKWFAVKERQLEALARHSDQMDEHQRLQTERLEQRVRVLERIVTDKGLVLGEEIERLRDLR